MASQPPQYHEKLFSEEVLEADKEFYKPQPVYEFRGRVFREEPEKPYEPPK